MACLILGAVILATYFLRIDSTSKGANSAPPSDSLTDSPSPSGENGDSLAVGEASAAAQNSAVLSGASPETNSQKSGSRRQGTEINEKLQKEVLKFGELHRKAVLSSSEESEIQELLRSSQMIREVGQMLRSQKLLDLPNAVGLQNAGIDFLKQALQFGDEESIRDTIWDIIRDPQIEDPAIPIEDRQQMAAPKAELMFHASALRPDLFPDIEMDLPGPASQQIWKNIQQKQSDNLEESIEEAQKFENSKKGP